MKEILGNNLEVFFGSLRISAERTYKGGMYEVWNVRDEDFKLMCNMEEDEFVKNAGDDAWWRSCTGSNMFPPNEEYIIKGNKIMAWRYLHERNIKYSSLSEYLCEEIGASQPKNVCALATDLAKYNYMTMGELFQKYE